METKPDSQTAARIKEKLSDEWWRLNNLYWIMDESGKKIKFKPNWAQRMFYNNMWYLSLVLKARQLGFTTFIQIFILDRCLFNSNVRAGVIAHNREDAAVFFRDKIKFAYDNLPEWLKAERPATKNDAGELLLANNSSIRVGTSMRSGTLQYLHISEFGKICRRFPEKAKEIVTGSLNTVHEGCFVFIESTAEGKSGPFYKLVDAARKALAEGLELTKLDYKFFFFPWWKKGSYRTDPKGITVTKDMADYFQTLEDEHGIKLDDYQRAWYVKKEAVQQDSMKQEHPSTPDEAFEQAIDGAYYARQMLWLRKNHRICDVPYDPKLVVDTFWDIGRNDQNSIWLMQRAGMANRFIEYYSNSGESIQFYAKWLQEKGYVYGTCYLPHDAEVVDYTRADNKTRAQVLQGLGFKVEVVPRVNEKGEAHQAVRDVLPTCWIDKTNCSEGIDGLDNYQREWDDKLGAYKSAPLHNWASHPNDAFEQFARGYGAPPATKQKKRKKSWRTR